MRFIVRPENGNIVEDYHKGVKAGLMCAARIVASLSPVEPIDAQVAYYKGMQDGIKKCTERLKRLNDEADNS